MADPTQPDRRCALCHEVKPYEDFVAPPRPGRRLPVEPNCRACRRLTGQWNSRLKAEGLNVVQPGEVIRGRPRVARKRSEVVNRSQGKKALRRR